MNNNKNGILITSFLLVLFFSFYFDIGHRTEGEYHYYGFPADWLVLFEGDLRSFKLLGILFNSVFFYFITLLIIKIFKKVLRVIRRKK
ncbi:MAG: hypothetical protein ACQEWU_13405 [Bacillota bacterium]|nr:hypothetical protein [Priestia megaterium]